MSGPGGREAQLLVVGATSGREAARAAAAGEVMTSLPKSVEWRRVSEGT